MNKSLFRKVGRFIAEKRKAAWVSKRLLADMRG
jgi:hypothetical protein